MFSINVNLVNIIIYSIPYFTLRKLRNVLISSNIVKIIEFYSFSLNKNFGR